MEKYIKIYDIVNRLTDDKTFKTFFVLYLMADNQEERSILNDRFWGDAAELSKEKQQLLKAELTRCFLKLPKLVNELAYKAKQDKVIA